jgi:hypothetical protein
VEAIWRNGR